VQGLLHHALILFVQCVKAQASLCRPDTDEWRVWRVEHRCKKPGTGAGLFKM
jgi:hypothetical protein